MNIKWICIVAGVMALLAILPSWPYSYYQILRLVLFVSSLVVAYSFYNSKQQGWALAFGAIAFLFNPIFPVFLNRSTWSGIDLITGIIYFLASNLVKINHENV